MSASGSLLVHVLDAGLGGQERAVEMDGQHLLPIGEGKLLDRMHDLDAGIGDEDVDPAEGRDGLLDAGIDLLFVGDVHGDANSRLGVAELLSRVGRAVAFEVGDRHAAAGLDVALGDRMADAAGGAGDEGNFAVEFHGTRSSGLEIVVDDLAEPEREVGDDVGR